MGKIRRGNYVFVSWVGDHGNHVHVYRGGRLVLKWSLDDWHEEPGFLPPSKKLRNILGDLVVEGRIGYESKKSRF